MEGLENVEKRATEFDPWLKSKYPNQQAQEHFKEQNYIPGGIDLSFGNFQEFLNRTSPQPIVQDS